MNHQDKKYIFTVEVEEISQKIVTVEASSYHDAQTKVNEMYQNEEIILDSDDFKDYEINVLSVEEIYKNKNNDLER